MRYGTTLAVIKYKSASAPHFVLQITESRNFSEEHYWEIKFHKTDMWNTAWLDTDIHENALRVITKTVITRQRPKAYSHGYVYRSKRGLFYRCWLSLNKANIEDMLVHCYEVQRAIIELCNTRKRYPKIKKYNNG